MTECTRCGRPARDAAYVCETCIDELWDALGDIPWLDEQLDITLTRSKGVDYSAMGGARAADAPLPHDQRASEARTHLKALLVSWALFCEDEGVRHSSPYPGLPDDEVTALSRWLIWRLDGLALHELGKDAIDEITDAVAECRRVIDSRPERWYAGPCDECEADLYAVRRVGTVTCHECQLEYDVEARREWLLAAAEDRLANAATCARAITQLHGEQVTRHQIANWVQRGYLVAHGHDGRHPLYRIGDVLDTLTRRVRAG